MIFFINNESSYLYYNIIINWYIFMMHTKYPFELPSLPYQKDSLEPMISSNTISFHHEKHHNAYVTNLNQLLNDEKFADLKQLSLEEIILKTANAFDKASVFNNAAQIWNHTFYWNCMSATGGGLPKGNLLKQIEIDFDNYDNFRAEFNKAALSQFGSGWAWLVWSKDQKRLLITKTSNADLPMAHQQIALLTIDVWEHAYYIDYQNRRADYIKMFLDKLVNWQFAEELFKNC